MKRFWNNIFKLLKQDGFSLAEGMVTAGILGIVSLGMLQGMKEDAKTAAMTRMDDHIYAVLSHIQQNFDSEIACWNSISGLAVPGGTLADINNDANGVLTSPINGANLAANTEIAPGVFLVDMTLTNWVQFGHFKEDVANTKGTTIAATDSVFGSAQLDIRFSRHARKPTDPAGPLYDVNMPKITKTVSVYIRSQDNSSIVVHECVNTAKLTELQIKNQICASQVEDHAGNPVMIGSFEENSNNCGGIKETIREVNKQKICSEMGGSIDASGNCIPFGAGTTCTKGFRRFINGQPECLP